MRHSTRDVDGPRKWPKEIQKDNSSNYQVQNSRDEELMGKKQETLER